ncbi:MAG TPA: glycosyltransferase [Vicinamibacterales bacterium]|nr:glycosyltransferase [Vicinamibacterales bacterium]
MPLVSVILPVYNRARSVWRAAESVLAQTYPHVELIVVDDGSDDDLARALAPLRDRVTLLARPHAGAYAARNAGIAAARGPLLAFIDSDDVWRPDRLARQMPLVERLDVALVFGDAVHVAGPTDAPHPTGLTCFRVTPPARGRVAAHFIRGNFVPTTTVLVRRAALEADGGFSEDEPVSADYLAWYRIARRHELDYVDGPVADYTVHADGISADLEQSLGARIRLFSGELARTDDPDERDVLRHLLFNLALHLAVATARGRAPHGAATAWRTASAVGGVHAAPWTAAFLGRQLRQRGRRLLSRGEPV